MRKITHIIRIKKFEPFYEIYEVLNKTTKFKEEFNKYEDQLDKSSYSRIVLSSALCVEGSRDLPFGEKIRINKNEFYFSHQILSNTNELFFSAATIDENQLKQFWLDKKEYIHFIQPLIDKVKNNIECIISEKSSIIFKENENVKLHDGNIINILKMTKNNLVINEISKQKFSLKKDKSFNGLLLNGNILKVPKIIIKNDKKILKLWIFTILIFLIINILIITTKIFPLTELKINYYLNNLEIKKIINSEEVLNQDLLISKNLKNKIPSNIIKLNNIIETMSQDLFENLIGLELFSNNEVLIKFKNFNIIKINEFINKNNDLNISSKLIDGILLLNFRIK